MSTFPGDLRTTLPPGSFGLVLISTVTTMVDPDVHRDLMARVHDTSTPGGDAHGEAAERDWLDAAGFIDVAVTDLDEPPQSIVAAVKGSSLPG